MHDETHQLNGELRDLVTDPYDEYGSMYGTRGKKKALPVPALNTTFALDVNRLPCLALYGNASESSQWLLLSSSY